MADASITLNVPASAAPGSAVHVAGSISDNGPAAGVAVGITVKDANGNEKYVNQTTSAAGGSFSFDIGLPTDASGNWQVFVSGGGATASKTLTVQGGNTSIPVTGVNVSKTTDTISAGGSDTLTATVVPANATNKSVTWSSSNPTVATVDSGGLVRGVTAGTATITVTTTDGSRTATCLVTVQAAAQEPSPGGGAPAPEAVTSTSGSATVNPAAGGSISLGSDARVSIPAGALQGSTAVDVSVQKASNSPAAPSGFQLLGSVYQFTVDGKDSYSFDKPVTLTFSLDPAALNPGEIPSICYYDTVSSQWVSLGGTVSGNTISVTVDHFTSFAVMAGQAAPAAPAAPQVFTDVPASYWASKVINNLSGLGYISGYPNGIFKPESGITRAEFVSIMGRVLKLDAFSPAAPDFKDVSPGDWYYGSVEGASHAGIVKGDGSIFNPGSPITREQMACILINSLGSQDEVQASRNDKTGFTDDHSISGWARGFVAVAVKDGLIKGYPENNSFRPQHGATRAEACAMIGNFLNVRK